jgi:hypothetical protein
MKILVYIKGYYIISEPELFECNEFHYKRMIKFIYLYIYYIKIHKIIDIDLLNSLSYMWMYYEQIQCIYDDSSMNEIIACKSMFKVQH